MVGADVVIRGGTIYDGSGGKPFAGSVALRGDRLVSVGAMGPCRGAREIDAEGLAVAPGFINMLSWSGESLIEDGRSQSEIRQGVTLEVMGEGTSMGPLDAELAGRLKVGGLIISNPHIRYPVEWETLGGYLTWLERRGVAANVASFVGSSTLRALVVGHDDRPASTVERAEMCALVRTAMAEGAMGVSAALVYPPATYSSTAELTELATAAAERGGMYVSHLRSEGKTLLEALDEFIQIVRRAGCPAEVYHLKAEGAANWPKLERALDMLEGARSEGLPVTADVYPYTDAGTGLTACVPPWAHAGGFTALLDRLSSAELRPRLRTELTRRSSERDNLYLEAGPEGIVLAGFATDRLASLSGRTLAAIASSRGAAPEDTLMDLIVEDESPVFALYSVMSEANLRAAMARPWVSFCSDAESQAPEGVFLRSRPHPRAYGAFARVLGRYVRDEGIMSLAEAIRRLSGLPAANLGLRDRGLLRPGYHADVVVFDPAAVADHATPAEPHRYASGMRDVFVNGVPVLADGEHTGALPGRFVRGPIRERRSSSRS